MTAITGLEANENLRVLDISNNQIAQLANLAHLSHLEELWASNNKLASFEEIEQELGGLEELVTVYFEGNPLMWEAAAGYRIKIKLALPRIQQIDASMFFPSPLLPSCSCLPAQFVMLTGDVFVAFVRA